jgi:hypothetical protein
MPYTPIIQPTDLYTHIYREVINEITRADVSLVVTAINSGIAEVKIYLSRYDLAALFGDPLADTSATFTDPYLINLVKDVVAWNLINLANPNINYDHVHTRYHQAITALKAIQSGHADPQWPYLDTTGLETPSGMSVTTHSNEKRNNQY